MTTEAELPPLYYLQKVQDSKTLTSKLYRVCFMCDHDGSLVETSVLANLPRTWTKAFTCVIDFLIGFFGGVQASAPPEDANVIIGAYAGESMLGQLRTMLPSDGSVHVEVMQALVQPQNFGWKDQLVLVRMGHVSAWVKKENVSKWQEEAARSVPG